MMICPTQTSNFSGLPYFDPQNLSFWDVLSAAVIAIIMMVVSLIACKIYRKLKSADFWHVLITNILMFGGFTMVFTVIIIEMRLHIIT